MMKKLLGCLLFPILLAFTAFAAVDPSPAREAPEVYTYHTAEGKAQIETLRNGYLDSTRRWQGIPGIERIESNGRLWATWFSGGTGEVKENYVILVTSGDGGETWSDARVIIDPDKDGPVRAFDSVLWVDPNGKLWILWTQQYTTGKGWNGQDGLQGVWGMYTDDGSVEDPIWSEPVRLCNNVCMNKPTVTEEYGWLMCAYTWNNGITEETPENETGPCIFRFVDYGKPWEFFSQIGAEQIPSLAQAFEHSLVVKENGDLLVALRTVNGLMQTVSSDGGKSWTAAEYMRDGDTILSKVVSRSYLKRLDSGALLLLYHANNASGARNNLTAALSYDDGATWPYKLLLDARKGVSYPDATQAADGTLYICYDYGRYVSKGGMDFLMCIITEEDIKAGKLVSKGSALGMLINNNPGKWYEIEGYEAPAEGLARLEVLDGTSEIVPIELVVQMFTDRDYTMRRVPTLFEGLSLVRTSITAGQSSQPKTEVRALTNGEVYVLTPATGESCSLQAALEAEGYTVNTGVGIVHIPDLSEDLVLMQKTVSRGETLTFGRYALPISKSYRVDTPTSVADVLELLDALLNGYYLDNADFSGDGLLTLFDILLALKMLVA